LNRLGEDAYEEYLKYGVSPGEKEEEMDYKKLWLKLLKFYEDTSQTNWGKKQIIEKMKEFELIEAREDE